MGIIRAASSEQSIVSSAARSTSGTSDWHDLSAYSQVTFYIECTVASGTTPTLRVWADESPDQSTAFIASSEATLMSAVNRTISVTDFTRWLRIHWEIDGTSPSFTFAVTYIGKY